MRKLIRIAHASTILNWNDLKFAPTLSYLSHSSPLLHGHTGKMHHSAKSAEVLKWGSCSFHCKVKDVKGRNKSCLFKSAPCIFYHSDPYNVYTVYIVRIVPNHLFSQPVGNSAQLGCFKFSPPEMTCGWSALETTLTSHIGVWNELESLESWQFTTILFWFFLIKPGYKKKKKKTVALALWLCSTYVGVRVCNFLLPYSRRNKKDVSRGPGNVLTFTSCTISPCLIFRKKAAPSVT